MFGSKILEVVIGIVFFYLLLSLVCSALNELVSRFTSMRAKSLEAGIRNLLNDPEGKELTKDFYGHPLIAGLTQEGKKPSYIPSHTFSSVLMDIVAPGKSAVSGFTINELQDTVSRISNDRVKKSLLVFLNSAENNVHKVRESIENWFDDAMQRVSGWYKRKIQLIILILALGVTVLFNADTFMIANSLFRDDILRNAVVSAVEDAVKKPVEENKETPLTKMKQLQEELEQFSLPVGWSMAAGDFRGIPRGVGSWVTKVFGLLFTAIAVSLGAPFWFDVLNKIVNLRSSGDRPAKTALKMS